jgi:HD superfamily phosphohydrolase
MAGGRIADPIHGYVDFTALERKLLDTRVTQRLRHVAQNGLAEYVFPEAKTSRLSHSLGTMHLATAFLGQCIGNAGDEDRAKALTGIRESVTQAAGIGHVGAQVPPLVDKALGAYRFADDDYQDHLLIFEQALRLAAFFHDVGHLPLSHDFEEGLESYWHELPEAERDGSALKELLEQRPGQEKVHERLGHALSTYVLQETVQAQPAEYQVATTTVFNLAKLILETQEPPNQGLSAQAIAWAHSLIDGELDVDRCDYILRDGKNHGFEFATYDLARLLDNLAVASNAEGRLTTVVQIRGLTAVESFLLARYRSYQNGVRHHKVAQVGAAARLVVGRVMMEMGQDASVQQFVEDLRTINSEVALGDQERRDLLNRFAAYDDVWWHSILRRVPDAHRDEWLELLCWRQRGPVSLWKRADQLDLDLAAWNARLPDWDDPEARQRWVDVVSDLKTQGVIVVRHRFAPFYRVEGGAGADSLLQVVADDGLRPLSAVSPVVHSLAEAWDRDVQVHAFRTSDAGATIADVLGKLDEALNPA